MALTWTQTPIPLALLKAANLLNATLRLLRGEAPSARPYVVDIGTRRHLFFNDKSVQSSMLLDRPFDLLTPYTQKMMAFLLLNERPRNIVMIGLGGGSLAKFCHHHFPEARITVCEVNARIIALRERFCIPADDARFRVIHGDGIEHLRTLGEDVDVLLVDAFDAEGVDPGLADSDFYANAARCLQERGVFVMNFSGVQSRYAQNFRQIDTAFRMPPMMVPVDDSDNLLVFACNTDAGPLLLEHGDSVATALNHKLALDFTRYLAKLRTSYTSITGP
jgi:spermidine synthase